MIILSGNSKEQLVRIEITDIRRNCYNSKEISMSVDFGKHRVYENFKQVIEDHVFRNVIANFREDDIIDDLCNLPAYVYVYKVDEGDSNISYIPLSDLLMSDNDDELALGTFLAARFLYLEKNMSGFDKIYLTGKENIGELDAEKLTKIILDRDKSGIASFIGDILIGDSEELLYKNSLKLDQTGELAYSYIQQSYSVFDEAEKKIIEKDTDGFYTIELLNFVDSSPMPLAEKIVSINNPFRIVDFINRYNEYLYNVKSDGRLDMEFVKSEELVMNYLVNALARIDYTNIDVKVLLDGSVHYETSLSDSLIKILDVVVSNGDTNSIRNLFNMLKNQFNNEFIDKFEYGLEKKYIERIKHYNVASDTIYTVIIASSKIFISEKTMSEFLKLSEELILESRGIIELSDII